MAPRSAAPQHVLRESGSMGDRDVLRSLSITPLAVLPPAICREQFGDRVSDTTPAGRLPLPSPPVPSECPSSSLSLVQVTSHREPRLNRCPRSRSAHLAAIPPTLAHGFGLRSSRRSSRTWTDT